MTNEENKSVLIGVVHKYGYEITTQDGELVYEAGNNPLDSGVGQSIEVGLPISKLAKYCNQTGREISQETDSLWNGIQKEAQSD